MAPTIRPYGSWASPITAESIASGSRSLAHPSISDDHVWWLEGRPSEDGRQVVVHSRFDGSDHADAIGRDSNVRSRVHEYGGGAYAVGPWGLLFSNDADGRVYRDAIPITPEQSRPRTHRYADFAVTADASTVICVHESHEGEGEPVNDIVSLPMDGSAAPSAIASGHDFFSSPRISPDGTRLAFLSWDHPSMPWNGTEVWLAAVDGSGAERVAGGPEESISNVAWSPDGRLHWVSDRSGWWNLYREGEPLHPGEAEFAMPLWGLGQATYAFMDDGRIACIWTSQGFPHLGVLDPSSGELEELAPEYVPMLRVPRIVSDGRRLAYVGASPTRAPAVVVLDPATSQLTVIARSTDDDPEPGYLSEPEPIEFNSNGRTAHALYYRPRNTDFAAPDDELPPLLVLSHGGPTAQTEPALDLRTQFWTSRGFAVVDVNYGGSTGYGREYRDLLHHQWGVVDLEDCTEAAMHLSREGLADRERLAIRGGSAGGYTTLCALVFTDVFHAGASYYGVADVQALMEDTHKFESRYEDWLVPADKVYERSPIHFVDRITAAVIVFQGLDDPVVPPEQAELIVEALRNRGVEYEYHAYEGESHGFRKAETIIDSLNAELAFYARVLA